MFLGSPLFYFGPQIRGVKSPSCNSKPPPTAVFSHLKEFSCVKLRKKCCHVILKLCCTENCQNTLMNSKFDTKAKEKKFPKIARRQYF